MANAQAVVESLAADLPNFLTRPTPFLGAMGLPAKLNDGQPYVGTNTLLLLIEQVKRGFSSNLWGGMISMRNASRPVLKGSKASYAIFAGTEKVQGDEIVPLDSNNQPIQSAESDDTKYRKVFKSFPVFNEQQGDGFELLGRKPLPSGNSVEIREYIDKLRAEIEYRKSQPETQKSIATLKSGEVDFIVELSAQYRALQKGFCLNREFPMSAITAACESATGLMKLCGLTKQLMDPATWKMPAEPYETAIPSPEIQPAPVPVAPVKQTPKPVMRRATIDDWPGLKGLQKQAPGTVKAEEERTSPPSGSLEMRLDW